MTHPAVLNIRITEEMHAALKQREKETLVPTSRWIRQLVEQKLKAEKSKP